MDTILPPIRSTPAVADEATPRQIPLGERSEWLDALRGFALLGILLVNIAAFSGHAFLDPAAKAQLPWHGADKVLEYLAHALLEAKFYSLFSFLFGLGFAVQMRRAEACGGGFEAAFRRRLGWLLVFGLAHAFLLWFGDILNFYALLGFVLLWFRRLPARALLLSGLFFLTAPVWLYAAYLAYALIAQAAPVAPPESSAGVRAIIDAYAHGSYADIVHSNTQIYGFAWIRRIVRFQLLRILGMFLLGAWAGKIGLPQARDAMKPLLRRLLFLGLAIGLPLNLLFAAIGGNDALLSAGARGMLAITAGSIGIPLLSLAYAAAFALYWRRPRGGHHLLVASGRMALSHYLAQSIACMALFYGIGFGLFGHTSYTVGMSMALAVFVLLAMACSIWLRFFAQGPMETLWRRLTYARAGAK